MKQCCYLGVAAWAVVVLVWSAGTLPAADAEHTVATLAHIKLSGSLDETPVASDPLFGTSSENFKSKLDRIKKARDDSAVHGLYLEIVDVSAGWGKIEELRGAIADFRKSGKKAFAYLNEGSSKDYLIAMACDEVAMPESGELLLTGLRAEVMFYKDLFDKVGIKADMLQIGDFKGYAEPYTRNGMSKEFRGQLDSLLDDIYEQTVVGAIAGARSARKLTPPQVKKIIDEAPYTARAAEQVGLIDRVAYANDFEDSLKTELKAERVKVSRNYAQAKADVPDLSNPFNLLKLLSGPSTTSSSNAKPKVAVIYATGMIVMGKGGDTLLGGQLCGEATLVEAIRQAEQDKTVKAIVLRVDSPGGSALASDLIWHELRKSKKPVLASMSDVAASGGYYISAGCQKIYAEPSTITGSIGVGGGKIALAGLEEKLGLKTDVITRGAHANIMSPTVPFNESERKAMTGLMRDIYDLFLSRVQDCRQRAGKEMTREHLEKDLAGGRIWTGRQAKERGLVDELGTLGDAIAEARKLGGLPEDGEPELLILPKPRNVLDALMDMKSDTRLPALAAGQLVEQVPELARPFSGVEGWLRLRGEAVCVVLPYHLDVR
jgi:protease IV